MTRIEIYIIALLLFAGWSGAMYFKGAHATNKEWQAREDAAKVKSDEEYKKESDKNAELSIQLALAQAKTNVIYKTITNEVQHVIERPIYSACLLDVDGVRLRDDAYRGTNSKAAGSDQSNGAMPAATPTKWLDNGKPAQ